MKRKVSFLLAIVMIVLSLPFAGKAVSIEDFTDVKKGEWYYNSVEYVVEKGLMSGVSSTLFDPNDNMTRAMFVAVIGRHAGADISGYTGSSFSDVDINRLSWAFRYIEWAKDNGIVAGTSDDTFSPDAPVTREQMAAFFCRYAEYLGYDTDGCDINSFLRFGDSSEAGDWAKTSLTWASSFKLIGGTGTRAGTPYLSPKGLASRAQVATVLRIFDNTRFETDTPIGRILICGNDIGEYKIVYGTKQTGNAEGWTSSESVAKLLQDYILRSTGQRIETDRDSETVFSEKEILVGITNREGKEGGIAAIDRSGLERQEYIIKTEGARLIITSTEEYCGTELGAYWFIEDTLGWDIYNFASYVNIPKNEVSVPDGYEYRGKPFADYRCPMWYGGLDNPNNLGTDDFAKNNYKHVYDSSGKEKSGYYVVDGFNWNGKVRNTISPYRYEEALQHINLPHTLPIMVSDWHNDDGSEMTAVQIRQKYNSLFSGDQAYLRNDPCLTDEINIQNVITCARAFCELNENGSWMYVCQGDGHLYCKCENCMKVYLEEGSYSGVYARLINRVCEALEDEYPDFKFTMIAYKHTMVPPKVTKLHRNGIVMFCTDNLNHARAFSDENCERNLAQKKYLEGWSKIAAPGNLFVWDYFGGIGYEFAMNPNFIQQIEHLCVYAKNDVNGICAQGNNHMFAGARFYILGLFAERGYTEFSQYSEKLDEYLFHEFGYGYTYIRELIDTLGKISDKENFAAWPYSSIPIFSADNYYENKDYLNSLIEKSASLATSDFQKHECEVLTLYFDYTELLYTYDAYYENGTYDETLMYRDSVNAFIDKACSLGLSGTLSEKCCKKDESGQFVWIGTDPATWE